MRNTSRTSALPIILSFSLWASALCASSQEVLPDGDPLLTTTGELWELAGGFLTELESAVGEWWKKSTNVNIQPHKEEQNPNVPHYLPIEGVFTHLGPIVKEVPRGKNTKLSSPLGPRPDPFVEAAISKELTSLEGVPIPVYKQILLDIKRSDFSVFRNQKPLFTFQIGSEYDPTQVELLQKTFQLFYSHIVHELKKHHRSTSDANINQAIHLALATRTQTFDVESRFLIMSMMHEDYQSFKKILALSNTTRKHTFRITAEGIYVKTESLFRLGNGEGPAPVGHIFGDLRITRSLKIPYDAPANLGKETHTLELLPRPS